MCQTRTCSKCHKVLPLTEEYFSRNQSTNTGGNKYFRPECKECTKKANQGKAKAYKLAGKPETPGPGYCCDLCGCDPGAKYSNKYKKMVSKVCFDHCHETLTHRGWLCDNCNRSMGMLGDDVNGMLKSAIYIAKTTKISLNTVSEELSRLWN